MDWNEAWSKIGASTKTTRRVSAAGINRVGSVGGRALDAGARLCAPVAERWDAEADRRAKARTPEALKALMKAQAAYNSARVTERQAGAQRRLARSGSRNWWSAARRAAAAADRAAAKGTRAARVDLKSARAAYPATLTSVAVRAHAVHSVPAAVATYALSTPLDWATWPLATSVGLVAAHVGTLVLGRRQAVTVVADESMSAEERQLMERLDPSYWVEHAPGRGLGGTVSTPPALEPGGIRCEIRLDGTWTVKSLGDKADSIRALLGARTALRMRITSASRGGWAVLSLATRSAAATTSSLWTPDRIPADPLMMSLGLDTETGEEVLMPFDERLLISGASGTGKSWSSRPLMAHAHLRGDLVLIDGKGEEATIWEEVCRVAVELEEIEQAIDLAHAEMGRRKKDMKRRRISVWDGRQLTVVIDEGQVVLAAILRDKERLQRLIELSSLGRSRGVVLWWATQYPVTDGSAPGVHKMIAPNLLSRLSLRVAGTTQSQVALDDCAHYAPHQIPTGKEYRGHGYLKGYGPRLIRTWTLDDAGVQALPESFWGPAEEAPAAPARPTLTLVKGEDYQLAPPAPAVPAAAPAAPVVPAGLNETDTAVLKAVADGATRQKEVVERTGMLPGTVSKAVARLVTGGHLVKADDKSLSLPGGSAEEVSA